MNGPGLSGLNCSTPNNLVLDSGVLYFNIDETAFTHDPPYADPVTQALANAIVAGATRGGATFETGKETRHVEVDGMRYPVKGLQRIDGYTPTLQATLLEMSVSNLERLLGSTTRGVAGGFNTLDLSAEIASDDYIPNVALLATLSGSDDPVILVLRNVIMTESASLAFEDKNEAGIEATFTAHVSPCAPYVSPVTLYVPRTGTWVTASMPHDGDPPYPGSTIYLEFSAALDPTSAEDWANYELRRISDGTHIPLQGPVYDPTHHTVTITPTIPFIPGHKYEFFTKATLLDASLVPVDVYFITFDTPHPVS